MSDQPVLPKEFAEWLTHLMDRTITDAQFAQLNAELERNPAALDYYLHFLTTYAGLMDLSHTTPVPEIKLEMKDALDSESRGEAQLQAPTVSDHNRVMSFSPETSDEERRRQIEKYASERLDAFLQQQKATTDVPVRHPSLRGTELIHWLVETFRSVVRIATKILKVGFAGAVVGVLLLIVALVIQSRLPVAVLTDTVQAQWESTPGTNELRRGWMALEEGVAKISFKQGAQVILQAPCRLHLDSKNQLELDSGAVTAWVPEQARGFTIVTANNVIKDFGTEFGVRFNATGTSEIHVFQGEIGVSSTNRAKRSIPQRVTQGQTAMTDRLGTLSIETGNQGAQWFMRQLPDNRQLGMPGKRVDLADIVGGGNGFGTGVTGGDNAGAQGTINPITGLINDPFRPDDGLEVTRRYDTRHYQQPNKYITVPELKYVDGIFVPDGGSGDVVVSSLGHGFAACPDTDGQLKWNPMNGWRYRDVDDPRRNNPTLVQANGISMHANAGITFDLAAIADAMPGVRPVHFSSRSGVPLTYAPEVTDIDIWVLVDGEIRFVERDVQFPRLLDIGVDLHETDRFLTLIVTDSQTLGDATSYSNMDWCFWEEPVLTLAAVK